MSKTAYQRYSEARERQIVNDHARMISSVIMSGFGAIDNYITMRNEIALKYLDRDRFLVKESDIQKLKESMSKEIAQATIKEVEKINKEISKG